MKKKTEDNIINTGSLPELRGKNTLYPDSVWKNEVKKRLNMAATWEYFTPELKRIFGGKAIFNNTNTTAEFRKMKSEIRISDFLEKRRHG